MTIFTAVYYEQESFYCGSLEDSSRCMVSVTDDMNQLVRDLAYFESEDYALVIDGFLVYDTSSIDYIESYLQTDYDSEEHEQRERLSSEIRAKVKLAIKEIQEERERKKAMEKEMAAKKREEDAKNERRNKYLKLKEEFGDELD